MERRRKKQIASRLLFSCLAFNSLRCITERERETEKKGERKKGRNREREREREKGREEEEERIKNPARKIHLI